MITIVAKCYVKENEIQNFIGLGEKLCLKSRKEVGCISYHIFQDMQDKHIMTFIEEWDNIDSIQAHYQSSHYSEIASRLHQLSQQAPDIHQYVLVV